MSESHVDGSILAGRFLAMLNDHNADAVDDFVSIDYINHNAFVEDGAKATGSSGPIFHGRSRYHGDDGGSGGGR